MTPCQDQISKYSDYAGCNLPDTQVLGWSALSEVCAVPILGGAQVNDTAKKNMHPTPAAQRYGMLESWMLTPRPSEDTRSYAGTNHHMPT